MEVNREEASRPTSGVRPALDTDDPFADDFLADDFFRAPERASIPAPSEPPSSGPPIRRARRLSVKLIGWGLVAAAGYGTYVVATDPGARGAMLEWGSFGHADVVRALTAKARRVGAEIRQRARAIADRPR